VGVKNGEQERITGREEKWRAREERRVGIRGEKNRNDEEM
jgi:hypothetical protein